MRSPEFEGGRLLTLYRRFLGEPDRTSDVFVGFTLFFGGIVIGVLGLSLFLSSVAVTAEHALFWPLREVAIVFAIVGLPALLLGIIVLLPVSSKAEYIGLGGAAICLVATAIFVATYPQAWNVTGTDYSPMGIMVYAIGVAVLVASTGAALVAHHLDRAQPVESQESQAIADPSLTPEVTDDEVRRDIDETVAASELTWGGVEPVEERRLDLSPTEVDSLDATGFDVDPSVKTDAAVDESVTALNKLRGWQPTTERGSGTDDQATALKTLREESDDTREEDNWLRVMVNRIRGG